MAVTITAPQSRVVARGPVTLSWTNQYPQTAYEVMYRKAGETAWSTFGKVTSTATSLTMDLSKFEDFEEYHYRVVLYSENATSGTTIYNGTDSSAGYSILVVPAEKVGTAKVKYGDGMVEVPVYKAVTGRDSIKVAVDGPNKTYGQIALGETTSPIASGVHVNTGSGVKSALQSVPEFVPTGLTAVAYIETRYSYYAGSNTLYGYRYDKTYSRGVYYYQYGEYYNRLVWTRRPGYLESIQYRVNKTYSYTRYYIDAVYGYIASISTDLYGPGSYYYESYYYLAGYLWKYSFGYIKANDLTRMYDKGWEEIKGITTSFYADQRTIERNGYTSGTYYGYYRYSYVTGYSRYYNYKTSILYS